MMVNGVVRVGCSAIVTGSIGTPHSSEPVEYFMAQLEFF